MPSDCAAEVISNTPLSHDYNVLRLEAPAIAAEAQPGQFVMVKIAKGDDPLLRRPFSVFEVLRDDRKGPVGISLLNKRIGPSTALIYGARAGDTVACLGPLGRPFSLAEPGTSTWMVAGGVGLAPFLALAESLTIRGVPSTLVYGARTAGELFYLDAFRAMGVRLAITTEDGSAGERGRVIAPLERELTAHGGTGPAMIYACGPEGMLRAVARTAEAFELPCQVSVERVMGCGMGGCYSCVVPMRDGHGGFHHVRSCIAGPVLAASEICWD
jgi:dihydroorotate dehydrogenase electron transfer subunit